MNRKARNNLINAAGCGDFDTIKELFYKGVPINFQKNIVLVSHLISGAIDIELIKFLVDNGADINDCKKYLYMLFIFEEDGQVLKYLIEKAGLDIESVKEDIFELCCENGYIDIMRYISKFNINYHFDDGILYKNYKEEIYEPRVMEFLGEIFETEQNYKMLNACLTKNELNKIVRI